MSIASWARQTKRKQRLFKVCRILYKHVSLTALEAFTCKAFLISRLLDWKMYAIKAKQRRRALVLLFNRQANKMHVTSFITDIFKMSNQCIMKNVGLIQNGLMTRTTGMLTLKKSLTKWGHRTSAVH